MTSSSLPTPAAQTASTRFAGLDGLRAVAVGLVIVYHLFPPAMAGGFIGVDVFFVLSGFLITSLLLRERATTGRISLIGFWQRRARRLLPAVAVMIAVCATAAVFVGGDVLVRMGAQVLGALTFTYNWVSIGADASYFNAATPELFRNLWSLGIEEQFYLLWPLLFMLLLFLPGRWLRIAVVLAAAAGSAVWMAVLVGQGIDPTRAYFGTDSHAFGLLGGVALAFVWRVVPASPPAWMLHPAALRTAMCLGWSAIAALIGLAILPMTSTTITFPGTLLAASVLSLLAILSGIWPSSPFGRAIDAPLLRYIGERSYGLYLWHWPLIVLLTAWSTGLSPDFGVPLWAGFFALLLTFVAAELSFRLVETPVRTLGFRGCFRRWGQRIVESAAARWATLGAGAVAITLVLGTGAAVASAPQQTSAEDAVQAGIDALAGVTATPASPDESPSAEEDTSTPGAPPAADPTAVPPAGAPADPPVLPSGAPSADATHGVAPDLAPTAPPEPVTGDQITAIGDSVMLAAAPALIAHFPGIHVDAAVSRSMWAAPGILQSLADSGQLRTFVVLALGTNGNVDAGALAAAREIAGPERQVILVNAFAPRSWIDGVNHDLAEFAANNPGTWVADWSGAIASQTQLLAGDQIHPSTGGGDVFASLVRESIDIAEAQRLADKRRQPSGAFQLEKDLVFARTG